MQTLFPHWDNGIKSYEKGGRIQCDVCGSFEGVYAKNYIRKDRGGNTYLKLFVRCATCGSLEVTNNDTGKILKQEKARKEIK